MDEIQNDLDGFVAVLSDRQQQIIRIGKRKGFVRLEHLMYLWTSYNARKENMERLVRMDIFKEDPEIVGKWNYISTESEE